MRVHFQLKNEDIYHLPSRFSEGGSDQRMDSETTAAIKRSLRARIDHQRTSFSPGTKTLQNNFMQDSDGRWFPSHNLMKCSSNFQANHFSLRLIAVNDIQWSVIKKATGVGGSNRVDADWHSCQEFGNRKRPDQYDAWFSNEEKSSRINDDIKNEGIRSLWGENDLCHSANLVSSKAPKTCANHGRSHVMRNHLTDADIGWILRLAHLWMGFDEMQVWTKVSLIKCSR